MTQIPKSMPRCRPILRPRLPRAILCFRSRPVPILGSLSSWYARWNASGGDVHLVEFGLGLSALLLFFCGWEVLFFSGVGWIGGLGLELGGHFVFLSVRVNCRYSIFCLEGKKQDHLSGLIDWLWLQRMSTANSPLSSSPGGWWLNIWHGWLHHECILMQQCLYFLLVITSDYCYWSLWLL